MSFEEENNKRMSLSDIAHLSTNPDGIDDEDEVDVENTEDSEEAVETTSYVGTFAEQEKEPVKIEHTGRIFKIDSKPTANDTFRFLFYHSYMNLMGVFAALVGIAAIVMVVISVKEQNILQIVLFTIAALIFIVNSPISLYFRAKKYADQAAQPEHRTVYTFSDAGLDITKGENGYVALDYAKITKCHEGGTGFYFYVGKQSAFLVPKADITDGDIDEFKRLLADRITGKLQLKFEKEKDSVD